MFYIFFLLSERLLTCINNIKQLLASKFVPGSVEPIDPSKNLDKMVKHATSKFIVDFDLILEIFEILFF